MTRGLRSLVRAVIGLREDPAEAECAEAALLRDVQQAHGEWQAAMAYCDQVTDLEDIDFAIYHLKSAQQRYANLLKEAKLLGICAWSLPMQAKALDVIRRLKHDADDNKQEQRVVDG